MLLAKSLKIEYNTIHYRETKVPPCLNYMTTTRTIPTTMTTSILMTTSMTMPISMPTGSPIPTAMFTKIRRR